jgi:hypothetical protein
MTKELLYELQASLTLIKLELKELRDTPQHLLAPSSRMRMTASIQYIDREVKKVEAIILGEMN